MGEILSFALGIETAGWVSGLDAGGHKLVEFLGLAEGGKFIIEKFTDAIRAGGDAFNKSFATGVSTGHLVQLGEAFRAVGLDASQVELISFRLQSALTGVNDAGLRTELGFGKLGLSMRTLRSLNPADQILAVSNAFQKLDRDAQTGVAAILFGSRGGAAPFLQLARQGAAFQQAFARSAQDAATFQKLGGVFSEIRTTTGEIGSHLEAAFAQATAGFLKPLQYGLNLLESIPWNKIGQDAATVFNTLVEAFQQGKLALLIGDSIKTGFEVGALFLGPLIGRAFIEFENLGDFITITLLKAFETPLEFFQAGMVTAIEQAMQKLGNIPGLGKALGLSGYKADDFQKNFGDEKKSGANILGLTIGQLNDAMNGDIAGRRKDSNSAFAKALADALNGPIKEFVGRNKGVIKAPNIHGPQSQDQTGNPNALLVPPSNNNTQYEKIGFILNTVAAMSGDHARQTAHNTAHMAATLDRIADHTQSNGPGQNAFMHHTP